MASPFLELAFLFDDDFGLLLAAEDYKLTKISSQPKFDFSSYEAPRCKADFRFLKEDITRLRIALRIPAIMRTSQGQKFSGIEGLCILLRRLAYPNRWNDLQPIFGRSTQDLSNIFYAVLEFIYLNYSHLVTSLNHWWLSIPMLENYSRTIADKGSVLHRCFGFIDGTIHRICRPVRFQREVYSGHKRTHCLKYQSVVTPNGLIANLYGPISGRRHDSFMFSSSQLSENLQAHLGAQNNFYVYGDSGYGLKRHVITPYQGNNITVEQQTFNTCMSRMRICVEWEFGELFEQFAFLDYKKNQKIYLQPLSKYIFVATILKNCQTCLYGSQTSAYFNLNSPTLESYLRDDPNL